VAPGRVAPQNINGTRKTVEVGTVTVTAAPDALKADDARWRGPVERAAPLRLSTL